jgi:DNA-binding beta-propeller fold protein YncE
VIVCVTLSVIGSIRTTVAPTVLAAQIAPPPVTMLPGSPPTRTWSITAPVTGSIRVITPAPGSAAHTEPAPQGPWPTITVGNGTVNDLPTGIAIDVTTDTVYVANGGANTVSVVNGATCNATVTSGCGQTPAQVPVGAAPITATADPANHTVYIANTGSTTVSMLNSATCNATDLAGCPATPPPTADVGATPVNVEAAPATHTVYVTTIGAQAAQNGWAVLNADTCNATVQAGCGTIGRLTGDPAGPNDGVVDPANDTLYTANYDNTVSAFDLRHCRAGDLAGCATDKPGTVTPFPWPGFEHDLWGGGRRPAAQRVRLIPERRHGDRGRHQRL